MTDEIFNRIVERYRNSRDFNGLHFLGETEGTRAAVIALVRDDLVQVVSEEDYPNPHIRPWPSRRSLDE